MDAITETYGASRARTVRMVSPVAGRMPGTETYGASRARTVRMVSPVGAWMPGTETYGASRARTGDLLHAMQALSQLSYSPWGFGRLVDHGRGMNSGTSRTSPSSGGGSGRRLVRSPALRGAALCGREAVPAIRSIWSSRVIIWPWIAWTSRNRRSALVRSEFAHLAQVRDDLHALVAYAGGGRAGVGQELAGAGDRLLALPGRLRARLGEHRIGALLRPGDDPERLVGGVLDGFGRLGLGLLARLGAVDPGGGDDLSRLLLGGPHPVGGRALALRDPVADAVLGLIEQPRGGILRRGEDPGDLIGRRRSVARAGR